MDQYIKGEELFNWYQEAKLRGNTLNISTIELNYLLAEFTSLDSLAIKLQSYQNKEKIESRKSLAELEELWQWRIIAKKPIQQIIGKCYWRDMTLKVSGDVLIPRPETELMIDIADNFVRQYPSFKQGNWLDLGTGSGAIALALSQIFPQATIYAVDKSEQALEIARKNAIDLGLEKNIKFYQGNWFTPVIKLQHKISGIVTNPPYIPSKIIPTLQPEVAKYEPKIALDGGEDGLSDIREIINDSANFLVEKGMLLIEIMEGQALEIINILESTNSYCTIRSYRDLANIERFIFAQKK